MATPTNGSRTPSKSPNPPQHTKPLTDRETALVIAWVRLRAEGKENKAEAARRAGYRGRLDGLSKEAARVLAKPQSQKLISELTQEALTVPTRKGLAPLPRFRHIMGINEILATTTLLAGATLDDVLDDEGRFDIQKARSTGGIHALKRIKTRTWSRTFPSGIVEQVVTHEVELRDRNGSLELMGRHFQLWDDGEDPDAEAKRLLEMEAEGRKRLADSSAIIESPLVIIWKDGTIEHRGGKAGTQMR